MSATGAEAYRLAKTFVIIALVSAAILVFFVMREMLIMPQPDDLYDDPYGFHWFSTIKISHDLLGSAKGLTLIISCLTLLVSTIGTASAVILGWRAERRQSEESKLKIQQLEFEVAQLRQTSKNSN